MSHTQRKRASLATFGEVYASYGQGGNRFSYMNFAPQTRADPKTIHSRTVCLRPPTALTQSPSLSGSGRLEAGGGWRQNEFSSTRTRASSRDGSVRGTTTGSGHYPLHKMSPRVFSPAPGRRTEKNDSGAGQLAAERGDFSRPSPEPGQNKHCRPDAMFDQSPVRGPGMKREAKCYSSSAAATASTSASSSSAGNSKSSVAQCAASPQTLTSSREDTHNENPIRIRSSSGFAPDVRAHPVHPAASPAATTANALPPVAVSKGKERATKRAAFLRLHDFLLKTHLGSVLTALKSDGYLDAGEVEKLGRKLEAVAGSVADSGASLYNSAGGAGGRSPASSRSRGASQQGLLSGGREQFLDSYFAFQKGANLEAFVEDLRRISRT